MNIRYVILPLVGALAMFGSLLAACGDDGDELTLEEFFLRVEELDDQFEADSAAVDEEFDQLTEDASPDEALDLIRRTADLIEGFVDDLDDLNAPEEAVDVRDEAVTAGRDVARVVRDAVDEASGAETLEDLEGFFAIFETEEAVFDRFEQACLDAEQLAADNAITVDFDCEDE